MHWQGKYERDELGVRIVEEVDCVMWRPLHSVDRELVRPAYSGPTADVPFAPPEGAVHYTGTKTTRVESPARRPARVPGLSRVLRLARKRAPAAVTQILEYLAAGQEETRVVLKREPCECVRWPAKTQRLRSAVRAAFAGPVASAPPEEEWPEDAVRQTLRLPRVSSDWDPNRPYVSRRDRPAEWTAVGLLGQLPVKVDDTVTVGSYVLPGANGGTKRRRKSDGGYRVLRMLSPGVALCLIR